jgi:deoxyribodipyrimidine photo-lyase
MIHFRGVSWIIGGRWMYYYLLDGDIASNFLSWQWVAGTLNGKPYLFNKKNIEKYSKYKLSSCSDLNKDYDYLIDKSKEKIKNIENKELKLPQKFDEKFFMKNSDMELKEKKINVIHPWCLGQEYAPENVGILITEYHNKFFWSESRLQFVKDIMESNCDVILVGDFNYIKTRLKNSIIVTSATFNPYYSKLFDELNSHSKKTLFFDIYQMEKIESFSKFWKKSLRKKT